MALDDSVASGSAGAANRGIKAGTAVTFTNTTAVSHTIRARDGSWTSGTIAPGASAVVTGVRPGSHEYLCNEHPRSIGQLVVE